MGLEHAVNDKDLMLRVPSPDARNVSNYMEANNIIKEEDEGDSDATSIRMTKRGAGQGISNKSQFGLGIENMAHNTIN